MHRRKSQTVTWNKLGKTIVLIDAANIEKSAKDLGWRIHYGKLKRFFSTKTKLLDIAFYTAVFETAKQNVFLSSLSRRGYRLVSKPLKIINDRATARAIRKANFDVEIAVDAMDRIIQYDSLVLFSGDSDFDYLVRFLRRNAKTVFVVSFRGHISKELARSANQYIPLTELAGVIQKNHPALRRGK